MTPIVSTLRTWGDMVKLSHSIFALPFAMVAAFLAGRHLGEGVPSSGHIGLILVCMVAARSTAMTFNRIVDAAIDARNPRTATRALPAAMLTHRAAWIMCALAAITFGLGCMGFHLIYANTWPVLLSGPVLIFLCGYSLTKRFTRWSHFYLGAALAISPPATWLAIHPDSVGLSAGLLMVTVICWVAGFDIIYSCQDIDVDQREGLFSIPSRLGPVVALRIARVAHALAVASLIALGFVEHLGAIYAAGVAVAAALLIVENRMVRPGDYSRVNVAFFTINGAVSIILAAATIADVLYGGPAGPA